MSNHHTCRIAIVGCDASVAAPIIATLSQADIGCRHLANCDDALAGVEEDQLDLILLGQAHTGMERAKLISAIRARVGFTIPLVALIDAEDRDAEVDALNEGADDCLASPAPPRLLLAQINAAVRRVRSSPAQVEAAIGHLVFRPQGLLVHMDGVAVPLTAKEYALALMLCRNVGKPILRDTISRTIWDGNLPPLTRMLDVHISRLRSKLALRPERGFSLSALYGQGYRLDYDDAVSPLIQRRSTSPSVPAAAVHQPPAH